MVAQVGQRTIHSRERWLKPALRLGILALLLGTWQLIGNDEVQLAMPTFTRTMTALFDMLSVGFAENSLLEGMVITNQALIGGFALALAVSLPLGIAMGSSRGIANVATPYLTVLLAAPMIARKTNSPRQSVKVLSCPPSSGPTIAANPPITVSRP